MESGWWRDFPPWGPPNLLHNRYRITPGSKEAGVWPYPPITSDAEVKERVGLYLYSPSVPSWRVMGRILPFPILRIIKILYVRFMH
jgi:hypothetical protein